MDGLLRLAAQFRIEVLVELPSAPDVLDVLEDELARFLERRRRPPAAKVFYLHVPGVGE
jgi:hypothetical protein